MKLDIFSNQCNSNFLGWVTKIFNHVSPVSKIRFRAVKMKRLAYNLSKMFFLHGKWCFIEIFYVQVLKYVVSRKITEQGNLVLHRIIQRVFRTADNDIRLDSHSLKFFYACLCRFCLHFLRRSQIRNQCNVDQDNIFCSALMLELTDGFKERLAFDITDSTADLNDSNLRICCSRVTVETALDLICNMRDYLNSSSAKISAAFFLKNGPVDLSCCNIGIFCQAFINKSFVMTKVKVCLRTVICNENLSVLYRVHCTWVNIDVRIEFLHSHSVTTRFQKSSQRCSCNSFSKTGYNSACNKYIFYCHSVFPPP